MSDGAQAPPAAATVPGGEARGAPAPVLELAEASKVYPGSPPVRALDRVTLSVEAGELVAVVGPSGSGSSVTIPVYVSLTHPSAAGTLDQAPVTVEITVGAVRDALVVPVAALLAQPAGYAVEVVTAGGARHLVPVTVGIFDDADGLVQVSGALTPGQHVVVPAT